MTKEKVSVVIDSNEASQNLEMTEIFVLHEDVEDYSIEPMDEGDIKIGNCLFERKTPSDFASSLQEGRLKEQVERMGGRDMNSFILVEGDMKDFDNLPHTQIPAKSLRGMVSSIIVRNGIPVVFCSEPNTLADIAVRLARKTVEDPTGVQTKTTETVKEPTFMENLFLGIDKIGYETAQKLGNEFESLEYVYNATVEELQEIDGVGPNLSENIYSSIHGGQNEGSKDSDGGSESEDENVEESKDSVEIVTI